MLPSQLIESYLIGLKRLSFFVNSFILVRVVTSDCMCF